MHKETTVAIIEELRCVDTYVRTNGSRWSQFIDELSEKYGVEPDLRPRLSIIFRGYENAR